ncbi:MAG: hypothetical protein ACD_47C00232G0005 [uncultured bacterium]|nr:MAG: hypothetical protein ACD_47C00232G0005 [uncultured bacterium]
MLIAGGRLIIKHFEKVKPPDCFEKIKLCDTRRYGNSMLSFYSAAVETKSEEGEKI